jgi:hypothetical protein
MKIEMKMEKVFGIDETNSSRCSVSRAFEVLSL